MVVMSLDKGLEKIVKEIRTKDSIEVLFLEHVAYCNKQLNFIIPWQMENYNSETSYDKGDCRTCTYNKVENPNCSNYKKNSLSLPVMSLRKYSY
jgi:hypothetical protein